MNTSRRGALVKMLVCVLLVAALAVQPALGGDRNGTTENRGQQVALSVAAAVAPSTPAPAKPVTPPATADPAPVPPAPATAGGPEDGDNGVPPPAAASPASKELAPASAPPAAEQPLRTPTAPDAALPTTPAGKPAVPAPTAEHETVQSDAPIVTSPPPDTAANAAALVPPTAIPAGTTPSGETSGADSRRGGSAQPPRSDASRARTRAVNTATDRTTGGTAPATALSEPLRTPATAAIARVGVRPTGAVSTSRPRPADDGAIKPLDRTSTVARVLRIAVVIPTWMWIALGALGGLVLLLGAHTVLAAARTRRLQGHREKLMEDIGLLQEALLPAVPPRMGALLTTVAYRPADGPAAGGDFYDLFALADGRVGLLLGDVSGHGRQALAKTTLVRFSVRAHLEAGMSPREAISIAGRSLDGRLADDFSTVLAAIHDPSKGTLTYSSAGHPPPLVLGPSAHPAVTASSSPPIGVGFPTGQRQTVLPMPEGTTVAIYSDGLLEARIDGQPLGGERLAAWLADLGPDATAKQLLDLVVQRADRVPDDLAAVVLHAASGATAPASRIEQLKLDVLDVDGPDLDGFLKAAGVSKADRVIVGRRVSEQLAITGGVFVEVRAGEHPTVSVWPIGDSAAAATRESARAR
ncbi:MAG: SpoIIE family protein phosphatase [Solirubrobacteraceae bacterium]